MGTDKLGRLSYADVTSKDLWLMPSDCLHMTALEVTHSRSAEEIADLRKSMEPFIPRITDYTFDHRARLVKPMLSYDGAAIALSFVPAAGEPSIRSKEEDEYSYHHLRRDVFNLCQEAGLQVDSRYVVPSAHMTIGRFISAEDFVQNDKSADPKKMQQWIEKIEEINQWLKQRYWPEGGTTTATGEWIVGEEKGLDCRFGTLWYGGGETIRLGKGFQTLH